MNGKTFRLKVSNFWKQPSMTHYYVSVDAKSRFAIHSKLKQKVFRADEGPGYMERERVVFLHYFTPTIPIQLQDASHSVTNEQLQRRRAIGGSKLEGQYIQLLRQEAQWNQEWRVMWDARSYHVRRALFVFLKGQLIDTRKQIYMLFKQFWYKEKC